jgi:uncharacterized phiE125 gp8 family phage protein
MTSILLTGPGVEPLSLNEAETFLRVERGDDDQVIAALIVGARMYVETQAQIALITQNSWRSITGRGLAVLPTPITEIDRGPGTFAVCHKRTFIQHDWHS